MPVINGVYLKDFAALPSSVADANIIPIAITGNQVAYRTTVAGIITDARITGKLLTGLSVTGTAILATDTILEAFGKVQNQINNRVSSVGLTMPSAFSVANSPITTSGTLAVTAAGVASQYIRGDGTLATLPSGGGGGASVNYYLNGSVAASVGTYYQMSKTAVISGGTDFTLIGNGLISQFLTDVADPNRLLIPAGAWNFEMYFQVSSAGGNGKFYVELLKYDGVNFTSIADSSAVPEEITGGTTIDLYLTSIAVPETVLLSTDRLAVRVYIVDSTGGRTVTLHTEDNTLCQITTTFAGGISALNGLTANTQYFATGTTGTDFAIVSISDTHTFNLPNASASARGVISTGTQTIAGAKTFTDNLTVTYGTTTASSVQATSTNAGGRALSVLATSTLEPFSVLQLGAGKLAEFSNSGGAKFIIYNGGTFDATGGTLTGALNGTSATFNGNVSVPNTTTVGVGESLPSPYIIQSGQRDVGSVETNTMRHSVLGDGTMRFEWNRSTDGVAYAPIADLSQLGLYLYNSSGTYRGRLETQSITANRAWIFPDATGTLALTSDLGSYLPLAGGTLTGSLSGTSATFSGNGAFGTTSGNLEVGYGATQGLYKLDVNGTGRFSSGVSLAGDLNFTAASRSIVFNSTNTLLWESSAGALSIRTGGVDRLTIASTGAATFSGAGTILGAAKFGTHDGSNLYSFERYAPGAPNAQIQAGSADNNVAVGFDFLTRIADGSQIVALNLAGTGAATFSSTITTASPSGGTAKPFKIGNVATVTPTSQNRTIEIEIDGTTYYLTAKTTNN